MDQYENVAVFAAFAPVGAEMFAKADGNSKSLVMQSRRAAAPARRHFAEDWSQIVHEVRGKIRKAVAGRMYAKQR
jgi:hypothetical protein